MQIKSLMRKILVLPQHVVASILTDWLGTACLPRLDVALCCTDARPNFAAALEFEGTIFETIGSKYQRYMPLLIDWATKRNVKVREIAIPKHINASALVAFFRVQSTTLMSLTIHETKPILFKHLQQAQLLFPHLKNVFLHMCDKSSPPAMSSFLSSCAASLERLAICNGRLDTATLPLCSVTRLHTLKLNNRSAEADTADSECELIKRCPNLTSYFGTARNEKNDTLLRAVAAHCPLLLHVHVTILEQKYESDTMAALAAILQSCPRLRTVEVTSPRFVLSDQHLAALAERGGHLTGFRAGGISEASLALLLAKLPHVQHLGLEGLTCMDAVQDALIQRCSQLRSLSLTYKGPPLSEKTLITMCQNLTNIEELYWHWHWFGWVTDELLQTIGAHCKRLRYFSVVSSGYYSVFTLDGLAALLRGCPLLKEVHIRGADCLAPQLRALRPDVIFRDESRTTCPVWRAPGDEWRAHTI